MFVNIKNCTADHSVSMSPWNHVTWTGRTSTNVITKTWWRTILIQCAAPWNYGDRDWPDIGFFRISPPCYHKRRNIIFYPTTMRWHDWSRCGGRWWFKTSDNRFIWFSFFFFFLLYGCIVFTCLTLMHWRVTTTYLRYENFIGILLSLNLSIWACFFYRTFDPRSFLIVFTIIWEWTLVHRHRRRVVV